MKSYILPLFCALAVPVGTLPAPAAAQEDARSQLSIRADDATEVIKGTKRAEDVFAPDFLAAVPPAQFAEVSKQLVAQFGPLLGVDRVEPVGENSAKVVLRFEKALATVSLSIEAKEPRLINGLLIQNTEMLDDSVAKIRADLDTLPGDVGVLFTRLDGTTAPALEINPETHYAIGSTFKLYILSALARSIENGERSWDDVVRIDRKSFPSGRMQNWPKGAPVTLHTLATLMISISDNTATDMLLYEIGREAVEAELLASGHSDPDKTLPFLSTLQMFALKGSPGNLKKYVVADEDTQRFILADFDDDVGGNPDLITPPRFVEPYAIDTVEWFASGEDLGKLLNRIAAFSDPTVREIMAVSTALPKAVSEEWSFVGYKGGSEPGVLNLTWLLQDKADNWHMLSLSWNNTEANLDNSELETLAQRILALAK